MLLIRPFLLCWFPLAPQHLAPGSEQLVFRLCLLTLVFHRNQNK